PYPFADDGFARLAGQFLGLLLDYGFDGAVDLRVCGKEILDFFAQDRVGPAGLVQESLLLAGIEIRGLLVDAFDPLPAFHDHGDTPLFTPADFSGEIGHTISATSGFETATPWPAVSRAQGSSPRSRELRRSLPPSFRQRTSVRGCGPCVRRMSPGASEPRPQLPGSQSARATMLPLPPEGLSAHRPSVFPPAWRGRGRPESGASGEREAEEMRSTLPFRLSLRDEPDVRLVNERSGLERVVGSLAAHVTVGQAP